MRYILFLWNYINILFLKLTKFNIISFVSSNHQPTSQPIILEQPEITNTPNFLFTKTTNSGEKKKKLFSQNGLRRIPVPKGENGFTFAHIRASFKEIADFPSSRKYTGPCAPS